MSHPTTLDHAAIAARVPHSGTMCLLATCERWSETAIACTATNQADPAHPLRSASGLLAVHAVEYASQAMALHGTLSAAPGSAPRPGFLASVRGVKLAVRRLDDVPGVLHVQATRLAGDGRQASYQFALHDDTGRALVEGRATVILDALP